MYYLTSYLSEKQPVELTQIDYWENIIVFELPNLMNQKCPICHQKLKVANYEGDWECHTPKCLSGWISSSEGRSLVF